VISRSEKRTALRITALQVNVVSEHPGPNIGETITGKNYSALDYASCVVRVPFQQNFTISSSAL
jgi:hypothetical protein